MSISNAEIRRETWLQRPARPEDFQPDWQPKWLIAATKPNDLCIECSDELDGDEDDVCDSCKRYDNRMKAVDNEHKGRD